jgi:hypothetical protein
VNRKWSIHLECFRFSPDIVHFVRRYGKLQYFIVPNKHEIIIAYYINNDCNRGFHTKLLSGQLFYITCICFAGPTDQKLGKIKIKVSIHFICFLFYFFRRQFLVECLKKVQFLAVSRQHNAGNILPQNIKSLQYWYALNHISCIYTSSM